MNRLISTLLASMLIAPGLLLAGGSPVEELRSGQLGSQAAATDVFVTHTLAMGNDPDRVLNALTVDRGMDLELEVTSDFIDGSPAPVNQDSEQLMGRRRKEARVDEDEYEDDDDELRSQGVMARRGLSYGVDGTDTDSLAVVAQFFDLNDALVSEVLIDNIPSLNILDPALDTVALALQGGTQAVAFYVELPAGQAPIIRGQQMSSVTGQLIGSPFTVDGFAVYPAVAALNPMGTRVLVIYVKGGSADIRGRIVDFTGPAPAVGQEFQISTSIAQFGHLAPTVEAASNGAFIAAWEDLSGQQGDPQNIRARIFDAMGNPVADDFIVNQDLANAQGRPSATAIGDTGAFAVAWTGDGTGVNDLDVFAQVYDADGNPISNSDIPISVAGTDFQTNPMVRFVPPAGALAEAGNRPQMVVSWLDFGSPAGNQANGTGVSYKVYAINNLVPPEPPLFADGFETGDTTGWSSSTP